MSKKDLIIEELLAKQEELAAEDIYLKSTMNDIHKELDKVKVLRSNNGTSNMYNSFKNVARNTIELEFRHIQEDRFQEVEGTEEYKEIEARCSEIYDTLCSKLPEELHALVEEFQEKELQLMCLQIRHHYKQGVISGLTNLKYLEEFGESIQVL